MITYDPTIFNRYAQALFNIAAKQNAHEALVAEARELLTLFAPASKIRTFLEGPQFSTESKQRFIARTFEGAAHPVMFSLLKLLLAKGRVEYIQPVLRRYVVLAEQAAGLYEATVTSAQPLDEHQRGELQAALEKYTGKRLTLEYEVDQKLIGGVRFQMGDTLIDDSVRGKLLALRRKLEQSVAA